MSDTCCEVYEGEGVLARLECDQLGCRVTLVVDSKVYTARCAVIEFVYQPRDEAGLPRSVSTVFTAHASTCGGCRMDTNWQAAACSRATTRPTYGGHAISAFRHCARPARIRIPGCEGAEGDQATSWLALRGLGFTPLVIPCGSPETIATHVLPVCRNALRWSVVGRHLTRDETREPDQGTFGQVAASSRGCGFPPLCIRVPTFVERGARCGSQLTSTVRR